VEKRSRELCAARRKERKNQQMDAKEREGLTDSMCENFTEVRAKRNGGIRVSQSRLPWRKKKIE